MKNGNKARDVLGDSQQRYRTLRTNQMARFVTVPFKKINKYLDQLTLSKLLRKDRDVLNIFQSTPKLVILLHYCFVEEAKKIYRLACT